ncbi:MAG: fibrobacter succinogenes major paralogous domain-containing protein [Rikenellaceae bacterium]|nr:fibrobacter succinogenes major paralogous domain-containing protein [Rikenellaceae bacterium]MDE7356492.1 fibrobacter succinogenes major paralogous domain-containing protein [Rikenellaceae bacterium]
MFPGFGRSAGLAGWSSSDYGYIKFTSGSNSVEFPAVGFRRNDSPGTLYYAGVEGYYWSSVAYSSTGVHYLYFDNSDLVIYNSNKHYGRSVRCVR